jgi:RNA polymerase sigma-70 factor (ECF subfamily)
MGGVTTDDSSDVTDLLSRAAACDEAACRELFSRYRPRLKRMVHLRLSRRLQGRVDDSDVVQEAFLDAGRQLPEYAAEPQLPFYLWLRQLTGLKLAEVHRRHQVIDANVFRAGPSLLLECGRDSRPDSVELPHGNADDNCRTCILGMMDGAPAEFRR